MESEQRPEGLTKLAIGAVLLILVLILSMNVAGNPQLTADYRRDPGPGFMPKAMLWLLGICSVILIAEGIFRLRREGMAVKFSLAWAETLAFPVLLLATLALYVLLVPYAGFLLVSVIFALLWGAILVAQDSGGRSAAALAVGALGSAGLAIAIYVLFKELVGIPLN